MDQLDVADDARSEDLLALDEALDLLEGETPDVAQVVKLRYFSGLTMEQVAQSMDLSPRTVHRHWAYAKARLYQLVQKN